VIDVQHDQHHDAMATIQIYNAIGQRMQEIRFFKSKKETVKLQREDISCWSHLYSKLDQGINGGKSIVVKYQKARERFIHCLTAFARQGEVWDEDDFLP
jgi:hypothetical protein